MTISSRHNRQTDALGRTRSRLADGVSAIALVVLIASTLPMTAVAQTPDDAKQQLESTKRLLDQRQKAVQGLTSDVSELQGERERINQSLVETARLIQRGEAQMSGIESRLGDLEAQEKMLRGSLSQRHDSIARLLSAMQRMGRNPPPVMITRREDALQMVRSAMMLAAAFPEMRQQAVQLAERLTELARVMGDIKTEGDKLRAETDRLAESRTRLGQLMETKRQTLAERQAELERVGKEAAEIAKNASDLSELINRLDKAVIAQAGPATPPPAVAPPVRETAPAPARDSASGSPPPPVAVAAAPPVAITPVQPAPQPAVELLPKGSQVAAFNTAQGRIKPVVSFAQARGQLPLPAQGRKILSFGERTQYGGQSKGMVIETRHGAQVTAPAEGLVRFAGEFRSYGPLLIIDAGDGYLILLAGLSQIDVQPQQSVLSGEPVGVMSSAPKGTKTRANDNGPVLYIEFRKDNRPIDPTPWWIPDGTQKVQG